jgi:hypothetical protein
MKINILNRQQDNVENNQDIGQISPLIDKAYYVDSLNYKIDDTGSSLYDD